MDDFGRTIATVFLTDPDPALLASEIEISMAEGADRVEIRIDGFPPGFGHDSLIELANKYKVLFSGGRSFLTEAEMIFLKKAAGSGAWIDIPFEEESPVPALFHKNRLVISCHREIKSFEQMKEMASNLKGMAAMVKIAPPSPNVLEAARFLTWSSALGKEGGLIAFPTGPESSFARITALAFGSGAVYGGSRNSGTVVPGQIKFRELMDYDPKNISEKTLLYGLTGYPLSFTKSPGIWNGWFSKLKMDARFLPFPASDMENALEAFSLLGLKGFGVTAPYKERVLAHVHGASKTARRCGAANTVKAESGMLYAANTDIFGVRRALSFLGSGQRVLVLGSGGGARAAVLALRRVHDVEISARSEAKGSKMAEELGAAFTRWENRHEYEYDLVINATPLGSDGISMPWEEKEPVRSRYLMDMVVTRGSTPFERKSAREGVALIGGGTMLCYQAALQFKLLTGKKPPKE